MNNLQNNEFLKILSININGKFKIRIQNILNKLQKNEIKIAFIINHKSKADINLFNPFYEILSIQEHILCIIHKALKNIIKVFDKDSIEGSDIKTVDHCTRILSEIVKYDRNLSNANAGHQQTPHGLTDRGAILNPNLYSENGHIWWCISSNECLIQIC